MLELPPLIRAEGLVKKFGDFVAVDGIDVEVRPGEAFGFLGPNGAGKSSTMRMIGCVSPPTAGTLTVMGLDPRTDGPAIRARWASSPSGTASTRSSRSRRTSGSTAVTSAYPGRWSANVRASSWSSLSCRTGRRRSSSRSPGG